MNTTMSGFTIYNGSSLNLSGLIGRKAKFLGCNNEPYGYVYECIGFGVDSDSGQPTVFLLGTNGFVIEYILTGVVFVSDNETR